MSNQVTRLEYCQYLLVTQINYTLTNFADHSNKFSHDKINRFLKGEKITPRLIDTVGEFKKHIFRRSLVEKSNNLA